MPTAQNTKPRPKEFLPDSRKQTLRAYGRKGQIIEAAEVLFSERGYHGTTMRDIAAETGILPGSLYAHIASKEDILLDICTAAAAQFISGLELVAKGPWPPTEKLRIAMRAHVEVVARAREAARVFLEEWTALSEPRREEVRALRDRYESLWDGIIREGIRKGAFRKMDRRFARLLVLSAANWTYTWYDPAGPLSPDEIADRFTDLLLGGLATKETQR
ncbi:MAG TPA: TetR/AcrR family transcriptional regulator [Actinomycetota bacterium]|nr:TetR/AcrR family transcriptional regulator [Actinomycetota bacterium]